MNRLVEYINKLCFIEKIQKMYVGFEINARIGTNKGLEHLEKSGEILYQKHSKIIEDKLNIFLLPDGSFDATKMRENWFPQIQADIFLSHSHADEKLAKRLAGYFESEFGLTTFIDSCVWGHADKLLKKIDKETCYNEEKKTYDYNIRNYTTTHVHMMLASALHEMIYNTETLMLLNTGKSVKTNIKDLIKKTESGWIFSEIKMSKLVEKRSPWQHDNRKQKLEKGGKFLFSESVNETKSFVHEIDTSHLYELNWDDIKEWKKEHRSKTCHPLDTLYRFKTE